MKLPVCETGDINDNIASMIDRRWQKSCKEVLATLRMMNVSQVARWWSLGVLSMM